MAQSESAETAGLEVPSGYRQVPSSAPFGARNGPFFEKRDGERLWRGFRVLERHCNQGDIVHGGMLTTFADVVMGTAAWAGTGGPSVTVRMVVDFLAPARLGDWVEGSAELTRATKSLVFVDATLKVGRRTVLTASGVYKPVALLKS